MSRIAPSSSLASLGTPPPAYRRWVACLGRLGWVCHGSVVRRTLRRRVGGTWTHKGPYYFWTCKVAGKTVCQALSKVQYHQLKRAIAAQRKVMKILANMHAFSFQTILSKTPGVSKRK